MSDRLATEDAAPMLARVLRDRRRHAAGAPANAGHVVIISDHDYRTARRANMHPIADALVRLGHRVSFISVRFSVLSRLKGDSRNFLWDRANKPEMHNGVQCYLWRTPFHPFRPQATALHGPSALLYRLYANLPDRFIDQVLASASCVIVESGLGAALLARARARNATAKIVYLASDELLTVGVHPFVQTMLEKAVGVLDQVCVPSRRMAQNFAWAGEKLFFVPHGFHGPDYDSDKGNPYTQPLNAVSVGSMLFDPRVFTEVAARMPQIAFHVIGSGATFDAPSNVHVRGEMPFRETIPFIRHATIGIAPYRAAPNCDYLSDTSMKLMQYEYLGLPAVCPTFAAGDNPNRFGYTPGDPISIGRAIAAAVERRDKIVRRRFLTWDDVARRLLEPRTFADTAVH